MRRCERAAIERSWRVWTHHHHRIHRELVLDLSDARERVLSRREQDTRDRVERLGDASELHRKPSERIDEVVEPMMVTDRYVAANVER